MSKSMHISRDASELGWAPGQWPRKFTFVDARNNIRPISLSYLSHMQNADGDLLLVAYQSADASFLLEVLND